MGQTTWVLLALDAGILWGVLAILRKHYLDGADVFVFSTLYCLAGFIGMAPYLIYRHAALIDFVSHPAMVGGLLVSGVFNVGGFWAYNVALNDGAISTAMPLRKLNVIFVPLLSIPILGEYLDIWGWVGVLVVLSASYVLLTRPSESVLHPFYALAERPGPRFALLASLAYSITSIADRFVTSQFSPILYTGLIYGLMFSGFFILCIVHHGRDLPAVFAGRDHWWVYAMFGALTVGASLATFSAFSMAYAAKVLPIIQVQLFFSLYAGHRYFQEDGITRKALAMSAMVVGITLVV